MTVTVTMRWRRPVFLFPEKLSTEPAGQPLLKGFSHPEVHTHQLSSGKGALSALSWKSCVTPGGSSWVIYVAPLAACEDNAQSGAW